MIITTINFRTLAITVSPFLHLPQPQATSLFSFSKNVPILDISYKWNHAIVQYLARANRAKFVNDFHSTCFQGLSLLQHVSGLDLFLLPNSTPLYGYTTFHLPMHWLGCFHILNSMNNVARMYVFISLGFIL